jgi:hypothetical protein
MNMHIAAALQPGNWPELSRVFGKGGAPKLQGQTSMLRRLRPVLMGGASAQRSYGEQNLWRIVPARSSMVRPACGYCTCPSRISRAEMRWGPRCTQCGTAAPPCGQSQRDQAIIVESPRNTMR